MMMKSAPRSSSFDFLSRQDDGADDGDQNQDGGHLEGKQVGGEQGVADLLGEKPGWRQPCRKWWVDGRAFSSNPQTGSSRRMAPALKSPSTSTAPATTPNLALAPTGSNQTEPSKRKLLTSLIPFASTNILL